MTKMLMACAVVATLVYGSCSAPPEPPAKSRDIAWEAEGYAVHRGKIARLEKVVVKPGRVADGVELVVATTGGVVVLETARGPLTIPLSEGDRLLLGESADFVLIDRSVGGRPEIKPPAAPRR